MNSNTDTTTFKVGDLIRHDCKYLGTWIAQVYQIFHFPNGTVTYETLGYWTDEQDTSKPPTLKRLGAKSMVHQPS